MNTARKLSVLALGVAASSSYAQVNDLLSAFDAGGRSFGSGGAFSTTGVETLSTANNPAALGFAGQRTMGFASRTFPTTETTVTGDIDDLRLDTEEKEGDYRLSHVGYVSPMGAGRGSIGISWTAGGWLNDTQRGINLGGGVQTFNDTARIRTDFVNISWGRANEAQNSAFGIGLVVATNSIYNSRTVTFNDPQIPATIARSEDSAYGVGLLAGVLFTPSGQSNATFAASIRTPIEMMDGDDVIDLYKTIPGRLSLGAAIRQDGYRGGRDYVVWGAEVHHFFGGEGSERIPRDDHTTANVGLEYNHSTDSATIPIRLGYSIVPAGGDTFDSRNVFTYGIGYRPSNKNWSIDIGFGRSETGVRDTAISIVWRF